MKLQNRQWQPLEGARQVRIYPYLRRPDILSSNAFLFDAPEWIVLIDPGALAEQTEELIATARALLRERPRPLLIFLTHCHIDHALDLGHCLALRRETPVWIAVGHDGADALASADPQRTIADLFCSDFPAVPPDILLLPPESRKAMHRRSIALPGGQILQVQTDALQTGDPFPLYRETLPLGGDDCLEWYWTPGHSPESACLKVGHLLFIGDILSAINPLVAGISGWDQQAFIHSAGHVIWLLEHSDITACCPGHGNALAAPLVVDLLRKVRSQAERLSDIAAMDAARLRQTTDYTLEILAEAEEVFSAISGRLCLLAYHLEDLEEERAAQHYRELIDMDRIDECLQSLRELTDDFRSGRRRKVELAVRATAIFQKLETLFDAGKLQGIIPPVLTNRGKTLLLDFINAAQGLRNPDGFVVTDLNGLIAEVLQDLQRSPHDDESILETVEDHGRFLAALASRLAYVPLFEQVRFTFVPEEALHPAHVAAARIADTLADLLGFLARRGCVQIELSTAGRAGGCDISIRCPGQDLGQVVEEPRQKFFGRRFGLGGLEFSARAGSLCLSTG